MENTKDVGYKRGGGGGGGGFRYKIADIYDILSKLFR